MGILRQKMVDNMKVRGYAQKTICSYTSCVMRCAAYFNKSPLSLSNAEIESFLLFLREEKRSDSTIQLYYAALNYFYGMVRMRKEKMPLLRFSRRGRILPEILNREEVVRLINRCASLKYRTLFSLVYSAGLRISEVAALRVSDIDYERRGVFVRAGKNKKSRYTLLADGVLPLLRDYLAVFSPHEYLFAGKDPTVGISTDSIHRAFVKAAHAAGIVKKVSVHTLRHCFATHLLEDGTNIFYIMRLMGHSCIQTTMLYLHMESVSSMNITSPIDSLDLRRRDWDEPGQKDLFTLSA